MRKEIVAKLQYFHRQATLAKQEVGKKKLELDGVHEKFNALNREINEGRIEFCKQVLTERKMTWCTECSKSIPKGDEKLILAVSIEDFPGRKPSEYSELCRTCHACYERVIGKHGEVAMDESNGRSFTYFRFDAEKRDDGFYYVRESGNCVKLENRFRSDEQPPTSLVDQFADEFDLPQKVEEEPD
jgi:hypothetical protein